MIDPRQRLSDREFVQAVMNHLDAALGAPAVVEDVSNIEHAMRVFVNRWCSFFGHRDPRALAELRELIAMVKREE